MDGLGGVDRNHWRSGSQAETDLRLGARRSSTARPFSASSPWASS